ncbi:hypothetical protein [Aureimonas psammosilenae]|uniref:hypothetical protein n=1 Tax=Aureimonas psammosilenae TaxID=2495496 RepID=UPI001260EA4E|nr:hypothetical protein [Aureimonas psammosilenae]
MLSRSVLSLVALAINILPHRSLAADATVQDMQIVGRALSFKNGQKKGAITLAVVYAGASEQSNAEMQAAVAISRNGLKVGDNLLRIVPVEQSQLSSASGYDGVFSVGGVDQERLRKALNRSGTPCFTLEAAQVKGGACTVAVRSRPAVSISINSGNAAATGVGFATAFIMMVREI